MFLYQTSIQIYDQIKNLRIWSKVKLHHSISLRFGLKEGKIALNITKFFMHSYLTRNITKICLNAYLPNGHIGAFAKIAFKVSENSSECYESWRVCLFIEMGTQIHFQISILKKWTKVHIFNLGLTILDQGWSNQG